MNRSLAHFAIALACLAGMLACRRTSRSGPVEEPIGTAFVGPQTLNLRKDLAGRSAAVGAVEHGERLDVLETRRRFVRVRTAAGLEGWTDANLLLSAQQMEGLEKLAGKVKALPSQGKATVYEALNMHSEPNRTSPSFTQVPEGGSVEVVSHTIAPRGAPAAPVRIARRVPAKKNKAQKKALDLPPPPAPAVPSDWQEKSRPRAPDLPDYVAPVVPPAAFDDWSLVRTADGKAGWVLTRMLFMAIPDEVAQYAEGHRITSYVALGEVKDGDQVKPNWLWTTASPGPARAWEFDSVRVFVWSKTHHRYETAYVERNLTGYYPVESVAVPEARSGDDSRGFSILVREKDGRLYRRVYAFSGFHIRMISKSPADRSELDHLIEITAAGPLDATPLAAPAAQRSWWARWWPRRWLAR